MQGDYAYEKAKRDKGIHPANVEKINTSEELAKLMEYIIIFDFRSIGGNAWIKQIIDDILPKEIDSLDIPPKERRHFFNKTAGDELKGRNETEHISKLQIRSEHS